MTNFRRKLRQLASLAVLLSFTAALHADDWPQWRGPNRDGISRETGLLKEWPAGGPKLLWQQKSIGEGYSTPSVVGDRLYVISNKGMDDEYVQALDVKDGRQIWSTHIGKVGPNAPQAPQYPGARSTPTVDGDILIALGSDGDLVCLETKSGKIRWQKNLPSDFGGRPGTWAYSESPLVDGDAVICAPGGSEATVLALNKNTGDVIWKSPISPGEEASYASAVITHAGGVKQYVEFLQKGLAGVDAKTGKLLWRNEKVISRFGANIPTPVIHGDYIFAAVNGGGGGAMKIKNDGGALQVEQVYFSSKLPTSIGGAVNIGDYLYGTGNSLLCLEFVSGDIKWEERALGPASLCYADGMLYLHGENGDVALVEAASDGYHEKGRFSPPDKPEYINQMQKSWSYPIIANGRLYIRDRESLWCYDIKAGD